MKQRIITQEMQPPRRQVKALAPSDHPRRYTIIRSLLALAGMLVLLQVAILLILQLITEQRKQHRRKKSFPHPPLDEVPVGNNRLRIYDNGHDLYEAMLAAIDAAQESVYLETYLWKDDTVGRVFKRALVRKAAQGVAVYVIFDSFGNLVVPHTFKVFPPAIHVLAYQIVRYPWQLLDLRRYALEHRKALIVDGSTGFIGGYNLGCPYATTWRDTHMRIVGPAAADLARSFIDFWNRHITRQEPITRHYPRRFDSRITFLSTDAQRLTFPIRNMYLGAIERAEQTIRLSNAYFVPDRTLFAALKAAAKRGVEVQILVPWISNHVAVDWLARGYFTECLQVGIRVFGYYSMLHAKTCTIDGVWSTIGTANLDRLSSTGNYEINAEVYSEGLARQMDALFTYDVANAMELTYEQWMNRPWYSKVSERILSPLRMIL